MDRPVALGRDVFWIGVNDRETDLFEALWPLPHGVSYNSYLVLDEKTALVDTVKKSYFDEYLARVRSVLPEGKKIDYLIINHIEPDHSGCLKSILREFPGITLVGNRWTLQFLAQYHGITEQARLVADGDVVDLGGRKLHLALTPMVHWPETMMTFEPEEKILFTGDVFGGYGALEGSIFDDEMDATARQDETRRYFANVLGKYSSMIRKALARVEKTGAKVLAPSHGPVWRGDPGRVFGWYDRWSSHEAEEGAVVVYGSMYENTKKMAEAVESGLAGGGAESIAVHDASRSHLSYILSDVWRYRGVALGSATYNTKLFPLVGSLVSLLREKGLAKRSLGIFGSYGWSGGAVKELRAFADDSGWNLVEPVVEVKGAPTKETLAACGLLGRRLAEAGKSSIS
jgi:flavorubredoxin